MFIATKSRKSDKDYYNNEAENFIPIACHYDKNTLLTKNGELLQIIQINGISSEHVNDKLFNLRSMVRDAIKESTQDNSNCAFWIHTIRRKTNLDDLTSYKKLLPANIHELWRNKNFLCDKFVNTLYITIVHNSAPIHMSNVGAVINSLSTKMITEFHDKYFTRIIDELNKVVDCLLNALSEYGAQKLGIRFEGEYSFSDPLFFYRRIIHLNEENTVLPIVDLSKSLASHKYAVGSDKIEVIDNQGKKFAAMLSIKEYHEVTSEVLDLFLQIPVEMITTEIFYFVDKKEVLPKYEGQHYFAKISGDIKLSQINGIQSILETAENGGKFCQQQISIAIIGEDLTKLEENVKEASRELSKIGIVHVREDINLEQTFWAQLPANFSFLRRLNPTIFQNTAALTSLHNFPTGKQYNPWGRAVTILRTEKGTPYFLNFHSESGNGNSCIYGDHKTGKTVITNFLISEATKYEPTILYFSNNDSSEIFINAIDGQWLILDKGSINPLLCDDNDDTRLYVREFLKILCNDVLTSLNEEESMFLDLLVNDLFALPIEERNLSNLLKKSDFTKSGGESIKTRLKLFTEGELFDGVFDSDNKISILAKEIVGVNLYAFTSKYFTKQFFPDEAKLLKKFQENLLVNNAIRLSLFYAFSYHQINSGETPKILVVDNAEQIFDASYLPTTIQPIFNSITKNNGVTITNLNISEVMKLPPTVYQSWIELIDISYILSSNIKGSSLGTLLNLNQAELQKLSTFDNSSRMFLVKQNGQSIAAELSLATFAGIVRILSAELDDLLTYKEIRKEYVDNDEWIHVLYEKLNNND